MPGYWNRSDTKERATGKARAERRQEERQGGGGQDRFSQQAQQAAEQRYQAQQQIDSIQQRKQLAETLKRAGAVTSGALSGTAFWKKAPVGSDPRMQEILDANEDVYYSTFGPGSEPYSESAREFLTGYGGLTKVVPDEYGEIRRMHPFNIWGTPQFPQGRGIDGGGGGGGGWGYSSYSGSGGGGRGSGLPPIPEGQVWQESPWGQSQIQQQFIDQQMGFANRNRGGIVSLLGDY